jgi:DNA-binding IclR family transcriptional regulator
LEVDADTRKYSLGVRTWEAANKYTRAVALAHQSRPFMERIRDQLDETVQLAVLDGRYNVYVQKVDGNHRLMLDSAVGRRLPAHATGVGKVLLAGLGSERLDELLVGVELESFTQRTITSRRQLYDELNNIRRSGHAVDDNEYTSGVRCMAVPVRDHSRGVVAAMSVSAPATRFNAKKQRIALGVLSREATKLSGLLGYR